MIISILNQKGGTGKTTLAVNIARDYTLRGIKTLLVDSDSQGSAQRWHERSGGELIDMTCLPMTTLDKDVMRFTELYDRIIIDGVPRISPITIAAIKAAHFILIPVQPSPYDVWATEDLVRHVKDRIAMAENTQAAFVISRRITGTNIGKEIALQLREYELPVLSNGTYQRVEYATTVEVGRTVIDNQMAAAYEIQAIVNEMEDMAHGLH